MQDNTIVLNYTVDAGDFKRAGEASSRVKMILMEIGMPAELIRRVAIAMYEGEINMVIHAEGGETNVYVKHDEIVIELIDVGQGIPDIEKAMQEGFSTASAGAIKLGFGAGMGLPNMKKHSDDMKIETEIGVGTKVTMKFTV